MQQLCASETAFAALKTGGDAVVTWGDAKTGGDSSGVQERLRPGFSWFDVLVGWRRYD